MHKHQTADIDGQTVISVACTDCGAMKTFQVPTPHYDAWVKGALIQRAMPEIAEGDRELLISGTCGPCFDKLFAEEA